MRLTSEFNGRRVLGGKRGKRKVGKIVRAVFYPDDFRLAGYIIKRPDLLFMFKRSDRFLAWDRFQLTDGKVVAFDQKDSWDAKACRRIGLDWDAALILQGMTVASYAGHRVGFIDAVEYDPKTGQAKNLLISTGLGSKTLVGQRTILVADIVKYKNTTLVMRNGAEVPATVGGLADVAGKQAAVVGNLVKSKANLANSAVGGLVDRVSDNAEKLGRQTGMALGSAKRKVTESVSSSKTAAQRTSLSESGAKAVGRQLKKTKGMFRSFQDQYRKASK